MPFENWKVKTKVTKLKVQKLLRLLQPLYLPLTKLLPEFDKNKKTVHSKKHFNIKVA